MIIKRDFVYFPNGENLHLETMMQLNAPEQCQIPA